MAFLVSPGVQVQEKDLTNIIPAVSTSVGGFAGIFEWGPALEATLVSSESNLIANFGYPRTSTVAGSNTRADWYTAANFLAYSNALQVVRVLPDGARNASSEPVVAQPSSISSVLTGTPAAGVTSYTVAYNGTTSVTFDITQTFTGASPATVTSSIAALRTAVDAAALLDSDGVGNGATSALVTAIGTAVTALETASATYVGDTNTAANLTALRTALDATKTAIDAVPNGSDELRQSAALSYTAVETAVAAEETARTAFNTINTGRVYTVNDVASGFIAALRAAGVDATADSDGIPLITDPTILYSSTNVVLPANDDVNGIKFSFFTNDQLDADVSTTTSASIKSLSDFDTEYSTLVNGSVYARYPGQLGNSIGVLLVDSSISASDFNNTVVIGTTTKLSDLFDDVPGTSTWASNTFNSTLEDEVHVVVYTTDTKITGNNAEILETYSYLSKAKNGKTADGASNYYADVVNNASAYVYLLNEETAATNGINPADSARTPIATTLTGGEPAFKRFLTNTGITGVRKYDLDGGANGGTVTDGNYTEAYDLLADVESVDVSLLLTGQRSKTVQKYVVNIADTRKDCMAFVSPDYASAVTGPTAAKIINYFNSSTDGFNSTSYAVFDSGWKRQYDRYNDEYFWIPLNADTAGLVARTEATNDAWWSPAGLNRGFIKNVVKLSYNPTQTDRDAMYPKRINPVVTLRGQGTLLFGDKTALSRPSAFDRINVRRLFIVLEKAIATAAKYQLFEFNDDYTRRLFVNAVEPFLADVKSRRGLIDYKVICDESNNTGEVIDGNRFVADIYLKPNRAINFITLNFVAVRTGVSFNEVVGA